MATNVNDRARDATDVARTIDDADTLTDLGRVVPRQMLEAARAELANPGDETDEG